MSRQIGNTGGALPAATITMEHHEQTTGFDSVEAVIRDIADGKIVIVTDDESRENEGDLIMAASKASPEAINMMIRHCSGIICVPTTDHQLKRLGLQSMVQSNREAHRTDFTVSVDAAEGITTGISAYDRCVAVRLLGEDSTTPDKLVQPGHIFPLRARPGGVLERAGHTEAAVDLAMLAGLHPTGVICELMNEDGSVMRLPEIHAFKERHSLKLISIASLIEYRHQRERIVETVSVDRLETEYGTFDLHVFRNRVDGRVHYALSAGKPGPEPTLVRVHSENLLADQFGMVLPGKRTGVGAALAQIQAEGRGVLVFISHPNGGVAVSHDGIGDAQTSKPRPVEMDFRAYGVGAQILASLGLRRIRLISSRSRNVVALDGYGLEIVEFVEPGP